MKFEDVTFVNTTVTTTLFALLTDKLRQHKQPNLVLGNQRIFFNFSGSLNDAVIVYNMNTSEVISATKILCAGDAFAIVNETTFAASNQGNKIGLYSIATGELIKELPGHTSSIYTLATDGRYLYSGSYDYSVRAWNLDSGAQLWRFDFKTYVYTIKLLDSNRLIVGGDGQRPNTVYMLNTKDGTILHTARDHTRLVYQIECTKDYVVTLGFDFVIVRNHKLEKIRSFSRDDHISSTIMENDILAVNHGEKNIGLFDLNTGEQLSKHDVIVSRIAYCGVPGMLVIGRNDGSMAFYNVSTKRIQELPRTNFSGAVRAIKVV